MSVRLRVSRYYMVGLRPSAQGLTSLSGVLGGRQSRAAKEGEQVRAPADRADELTLEPLRGDHAVATVDDRGRREVIHDAREEAGRAGPGAHQGGVAVRLGGDKPKRGEVVERLSV